MAKLRIIVIFISIFLFVITGCSKTETPVNSYETQESQTSTEQKNAEPECICHSKNPKIVKMHTYFTPMDCGKCHKDNPMTGPMSGKSKKAFADMKYKSNLCTGCHKLKK